MFKKIIVYITALASLVSLSPVAFSKGYDLINGNMDYRRRVVSESAFRTYMKTEPDNWVYYGAKFEPKAGIYIGTPYNRKYDGIKNGIDTVYDWFIPKEEINNYNCPRAEVAEKPSDHTVLKGHNWNFALKNDQVIEISDYSNYIYNYIDKLAAKGEDTLLVFGKEMNIDNNFNDPELFKRCFRFVAEYAHTKENIAMVWAPNDTGGLDTTLDEFYPGDEYVDWIGCSMYTMPFFQGNPNMDDGGNMMFVMGRYANPSMRAKIVHEFMDRNNIKKPVFVTEGGVGYESPSGIDYSDWAKHQIRLYYADICRAYPEFKIFVSFNQFVYPGDLYRYDLGNKPELLEVMKEVTSDPIYLTDYPSKAPYAYTPVTEGAMFVGKVDLSTYAYVPAQQYLTVQYLIDGNPVAERYEPPYNVTLTRKDLPYGYHKLTCNTLSGDIVMHTDEYGINFWPADDNYAYADVADNGKCSFTDMESSPAEMRNDVADLHEKQVISGIDGQIFAPDRKISRAEMAVLLTRMLGIKESSTPSGLTDVKETDWFYGAVNAAVENGLISGYTDNTFRGQNTITRNEFAVIAANILKSRGLGGNANNPLTYDDTVEDWVKDYVSIAKDNGIILERADNLFSGSTSMKRGNAAIMIKRLYDKVIK